MSADTLTPLLDNEGFRRDLPRIARLSPDAFNAVLELLREEGDISYAGLDDQLEKIAGELNAPERALAGAWGLGAMLVSRDGSSATDLDKLLSGVSTLLAETKLTSASLEAFLRNVSSASPQIAAVRNRRALIAEGGRTLGKVSVVTDLRVRSQRTPAKSRGAVDSLPKLLELIPLAIVKLSFASADDGDDCVFQLLPQELDELIRTLTVAKQDLAAAGASVAFRAEEAR